jgi:pseudaminic acid cytidylyltransferase
MNVAIIPARGGSRRIPRKNIRLFHGKPIISYSIETARKSGLFDSVVVSTDDDEIAEVAASFGASVIRRHAELAGEEIGPQEVVQYTLWLLEDAKLDSMRFVSPFEYACAIYATAPLMSVEDLQRGFAALSAQPDAHFALSVGGSPDLPLHDAAQFLWGRAAAFQRAVPLFSEKTLLIPIDEARVCDINTDADWACAERMYEALKVAA